MKRKHASPAPNHKVVHRVSTNCSLQNKAKILNQILCLLLPSMCDHCRSSRYHNLITPLMSTMSVKLPPRLLQELCENMSSSFLRMLCNATLTSCYNIRTSTCRTLIYCKKWEQGAAGQLAGRSSIVKNGSRALQDT